MPGLKITIRSPKGEVWAGTAHSISLNATDGRITILPSHAKGVYSVVPGPICIDGIPRFKATTNVGFIHVAKDTVKLILDKAPYTL